MKFLITFLLLSLIAKAQTIQAPELNYIFKSGTHGYKVFRIPALITTPKGTILAFAEGRVDGAGDAGNIDLVMRRSTNNGNTWSDLTIIRNTETTAGNPCPIIDHTTGNIIFLFTESDTHEADILRGKGKRRTFSTISTDDGITWSKPENITPATNPNKKFNWLATGPGIGIQIRKGTHAGRLIAPVSNSIGNKYGVHTIYSDDHGKSWKASKAIPGGPSESQIVELPDTTLMLNIRMQQNSKGLRTTALSKDGGQTWSQPIHDKNLPCPICQAAIITHKTPDQNLLIFSNPTTGGRNGMTLKISTDNGKTWPHQKLLYPHSSAYSALAMTTENTILCLYEAGPKSYSASGIALTKTPLTEILNP